MVKAAEWEDFCARAWELVGGDPSRTRYVIKCKGDSMSLRVTNGRQSLSYKVNQVDVELNRVKQFGLALTRLICNFDTNTKSSRRQRRRA
mmetsp:Transcript_4944/g.9273  ORF Transcript_4944/g.9273 Transcript_4944/m.9273 type:complete len:90 (+) Transcript_4944:2888-3157(+)